MAYISPVPLERTDSAVMSQFEFSPSPQPSPSRGEGVDIPSPL